MLTVTSEHPYYEYSFEKKFQDKTSWKTKRRIDRVQGRTTNGSKIIIIRTYKNEGLTLTSEHLSSEDWFETKIQAKFDKCDQFFEQTEE